MIKDNVDLFTIDQVIEKKQINEQITTIEEEINYYVQRQKIKQARKILAERGDISGYFKFKYKIEDLEIIELQKAGINENSRE